MGQGVMIILIKQLLEVNIATVKVGELNQWLIKVQMKIEII